MNIFKKKHEILTVLYNNLKDYNDSEGKIKFGLTWQELSAKVRVNERELSLIASGLIGNDEMIYQKNSKPEVYGIVLPNGLSAIADKKYLKERRKVFITEIKDMVSIIIPVTALLLSFTIYLKSQNMQQQQSKEMQELRRQVKLLQLQKK